VESATWVLSSEDAGPVMQVEFTKKSFLGYSVSAKCLFKSRLKCTASIVIRECHPDYVFPLIDKRMVSVFGSLNEIVIC
jgi:hypothetical protein